MGLFDRMRDFEKLQHGWESLTKLDQVDKLAELSFEKPVVVFKHSIRCGTSAMAKWQLEKDWDFREGELHFFYLDLIRFREVSNEIARRFGVIHQSPQIIVLHKGEVTYHTSHHMISVPGIRSAIMAPTFS